MDTMMKSRRVCFLFWRLRVDSDAAPRLHPCVLLGVRGCGDEEDRP
jgi:hypothetical protein